MNEEKKVNSKQLKEIELGVIAELMKNSRRSDRELAKALHTSQPTVGRIIKRLEKMGIIKEYTMIPDFSKLGYKIMGITQMKVEEVNKGQFEEMVDTEVRPFEKEMVFANLLAVVGADAGKNRAFVTLYKDYSAYAEAMKIVKQVSFSRGEDVESFLVDLNTEQYRLFTMSAIARHILQTSKNVTSEGAEP